MPRHTQCGAPSVTGAVRNLGSSAADFQVTPTFWLNPATGVSYTIATQTPQSKLDSLQDIGTIPIVGTSSQARPQVLEALASVKRESHLAVASHYNVQPVMDVYANVDRRDLGSGRKISGSGGA